MNTALIYSWQDNTRLYRWQPFEEHMHQSFLSTMHLDARVLLRLFHLMIFFPQDPLPISPKVANSFSLQH